MRSIKTSFLIIILSIWFKSYGQEEGKYFPGKNKPVEVFHLELFSSSKYTNVKHVVFYNVQGYGIQGRHERFVVLEPGFWLFGSTDETPPLNYLKDPRKFIFAKDDNSLIYVEADSVVPKEYLKYYTYYLRGY